MTDIKKDPVKTGVSIPLKIQEKSTSVITETMNITTSGAYCNTSKPLPLLSKVVLTLLIPKHSKESKAEKKIKCKGTVVRTHPVIVDGKTESYDVAIYFDGLNNADRELISEYIKSHSSKNPVVS